jgi:hypothetical protein
MRCATITIVVAVNDGIDNHEDPLEPWDDFVEAAVAASPGVDAACFYTVEDGVTPYALWRGAEPDDWNEES